MKVTEVDGIPTLIAPTSGPMHAGLVFRVGRADETLARGGITHLIEHLALHPLGLTDYHFNGATGPVVTQFHMQGPERDVAAFLTGVCAGLSDLPVRRMETEKAILRTEASSRTPHITEPMALWRHGARDHGLVSYPEWGLHMLAPDDLLAWTGRYFTRGNAVLWIAGDRIPEGLSLRLPDGAAQPVPTPSSALPTTPAFFAGSSSRAVVLDAVVRRRAAADVFADVLERELFRTLRQDTGLSYTAGTHYEPRGDGLAVVTAIADALPEKQDAVLGGFIDVLARLRVGRIDPADVQSVIARGTEVFTHPQAEAARLPVVAFNMLTGEPNRSLEDIVAERRAVTVADVHAVATEAMGSALLMVPDGRGADWAGFTAAPTRSGTVLAGSAHPSLGSGDARLVLAAEGVSLVSGDAALTVRFHECAAMLAWPDGARLLIGHDAISLRVEPTMYAQGAALVPALDAAVPYQARVDLPARDPSDVPRPTPRQHRGGDAGAPASAGSRAQIIARVVVVGLVLLVFGGVSLLLTLGAVLDPADAGDLWVLVVGGWVATAYFGYVLARSIRALR
ncbi:MAG TPA: insulinase family protein [Catenuloplanes sp.]|jgi:hypothetical protein